MQVMQSTLFRIPRRWRKGTSLVHLQTTIPLPDDATFAKVILYINEECPKTLQLWIRRRGKPSWRNLLWFWEWATVDRSFESHLGFLGYGHPMQEEVKDRILALLHDPLLLEELAAESRLSIAPHQQELESVRGKIEELRERRVRGVDLIIHASMVFSKLLNEEGEVDKLSKVENELYLKIAQIKALASMTGPFGVEERVDTEDQAVAAAAG